MILLKCNSKGSLNPLQALLPLLALLLLPIPTGSPMASSPCTSLEPDVPAPSAQTLPIPTGRTSCSPSHAPHRNPPGCLNAHQQPLGAAPAPTMLTPRLNTQRPQPPSLAAAQKPLLLLPDIAQPSTQPPKDPNSSIAPCGVCDVDVSWSHRGINCDTCGLWFHAHCQNIGTKTYSDLVQDDDNSWHCVICGNAKHSCTAFDLYGVEEEQSTISSLPPENSTRPLHASTPTRASRQKNQKFRPLRLINLNFRSITGKKANLENLIDSTKPDILLGTETHLDNSVKDNEFTPKGYRVIRKDRNRMGGGILIMYKDDIQITAVPELNTDCEILWAKICTPNKKPMFICVYYRPNVSDKKSLELFEKSIKIDPTIFSNANVIIAGDFNFPSFKMPEMTLKPNAKHPKLHEHFLEILEDAGLVQIVDQPTRGENCLDIVLTNVPDLVPRVEILPPLSDHDVVYFEFQTKVTKAKNVIRPIPLYKRANWDGMKEELLSLRDRIEAQSSTSDADTLWTVFKDSLLDIIKKYIPHKTTRKKQSSPWLTPEVKKLRRRLDRKYRQMKKRGTESLKEEVRNLCREVQKQERRAFWKYMENLFTPKETEDTVTPSLKRFYGYIKHARSASSGIPPLKDDSKLITDPTEKAELLNSQFNKAFSDGKEYTSEEFEAKCQLPPSTYPTIPDIHITPNGVEKLLANLDPSKATGPDGIPPAVLKELAHEIAPILTVIFQLSLDSGNVPNDWRTALVTPIFKKGEHYKPSNYRPVSLTSVPCKILEHIIVSHIMDFLEANNILIPLQHGFRKQRSCETQLLDFVNELHANLDKNEQVDVIVMDFAKAFDKVNHSLLVHKLQYYGVDGRINNWISSFLHNRSQAVVVEGSRSSIIPVKSGVPQGSVLGPCLFLVYINDLAEQVASKARLFADDTLLHRLIAAASDHITLQADLKKIEVWEDKWEMQFHPDKCNIMSVSKRKTISKHDYSLHGHILERVESTKYLGVTIQHDLKWDIHIDNIVKKANQTFGILRRNLKIGSVQTKELAYKSLVRPLVEYASTIWDPSEKKHITKIEAVQRRAARFVLHRHKNTSSVGDMLQQLKWPLLEDRRKCARLTMMYKIQNNYVKVDASELKPLVQRSRRTHSKALTRIPCNSNQRLNSFLPRTRIREWNALPEDIVCAPSAASFGSRLQRNMFPSNSFE